MMSAAVKDQEDVMNKRRWTYLKVFQELWFHPSWTSAEHFEACGQGHLRSFFMVGPVKALWACLDQASMLMTCLTRHHRFRRHLWLVGTHTWRLCQLGRKRICFCKVVFTVRTVQWWAFLMSVKFKNVLVDNKIKMSEVFIH
jgi:hypothetical protein